ncbi:hypothetical protein [Serratia nevei]|uniref:hypothetical protein n=1 Tax=Serratia nevei TaxID=2703794 RepID=UPI00254FC649|nr:hypothetical protein [Serratia nevei]MEC5654865.1 hypothetical protein [Serratia nevei]
MYFLDNNSGVNAMPPIAPVNSTAVRWFTEGSGSLPPSWPGMDWFNIIQAELIGILTAAGMSPDKVRVDQLATAIKSIIGSDALLKKNYLSEIKEAGAAAQKSARDNLGLGTAATKNVGTAAGNVMEMGTAGLGIGPVHKDDAYGNIAEFFRVNASSANRPGSNSAYGCARLPIDGAPTAAYLAVGADLSTWVGQSTTQGKGVTWARVYTTAYKPTTSDINAVNKSGDTMIGQLIAPSVATTPDATPWGAGPYSEQLNNQAPFFQPNWQWPVTSGGIFVPIAKGTSTRKGRGWPTAVSYGYLMPGEDAHARPVIHALGDSGVENIWEFNTQTGGIRSGKAGEFASQPWVNNGLGGRVDWDTFNREVGARATTEYVNNNFVRDIRLASRGEIITDGSLTEAPWGAVITGGNGNEDNQVGIMLFRYLQKNVNGNWYTVAYA